jgi:signal transduction histidine kinase/HAMP domain-containing protein
MRLSFQTRQVLGVTFIVACSVLTMAIMHVAGQARTLLAESELRGEMLTNSMFQRAFRLVKSRETAAADLQMDEGLRAILQSAIGFAQTVSYATITDVRNVALVHSSPTLEGTIVPPQPPLRQLIDSGPIAQLVGVWEQRNYEVAQPLLLGDEEFGSIRIGVSTVLIWEQISSALAPIVAVAGVAIVLATGLSWMLARRLLRPIHVLQSGIARLGKGEQDVRLELRDDEFKDIGSSFNALSQSVSSIRGQLVEQARRAESVVERLEDAVVIVSPEREVVFVNAVMKALMPSLTMGATITEALPEGHAARFLAEQAFETRESAGPILAERTPGGDEHNQQQWMAHPIDDQARGFVGVMLVARNVGALSQVQNTLRYSRKLASLNRLLAGVAHEVKNPLNAMTIHLELLRQKLRMGLSQPVAAGQGDGGGVPERSAIPALMTHVSIIGDEIQRLDQVVQGFLRFSRPEELQLEPVDVSALIDDVADVVRPQAEQAAIEVAVAVDGAYSVQADRPMLRQAMLNLALNAIEAMPDGGRLTFTARPLNETQVELGVTDTGGGIAPEHLSRVFELYFTTRERGSGLGLSMVYRTAQLHDGTVEVESSPGRGASFRLCLPRA